MIQNTVEINGNRSVGIGDIVYCFSGSASFSWNDGFKIIIELKNGSVGAKNYNPNNKNHTLKNEGMTYYGTKILY